MQSSLTYDLSTLPRGQFAMTFGHVHVHGPFIKENCATPSQQRHENIASACVYTVHSLCVRYCLKPCLSCVDRTNCTNLSSYVRAQTYVLTSSCSRLYGQCYSISEHKIYKPLCVWTGSFYVGFSDILVRITCCQLRPYEVFTRSRSRCI